MDMAANAPMSAVRRLGALVIEVEELRSEYNDYKHKSEMQIMVLRLDNKELAHKVDRLINHLGVLNEELNIQVVWDDEEDDTDDVDGSVAPSGTDGGLGDEDEETEGNSASIAAKSREMKVNVVRLRDRR